jgi:flagellar protein FlaJ
MVEEKEPDVGKTQGFVKRLIHTGEFTRFIIYLSATIPAILFIFLAFFSLFKIIEPINISISDSNFIFGTPVDFLLIAIFIFTGIFGFYEFIRLHRTHRIDDRFPDFVRDIAETRRAGMTFTKAIMNSSKGNYGILTPEIKKIAREISWGSSVDNALKRNETY